MRKCNGIKLIVPSLLLASFSGCALKEHFPDKEKDYQFRQEIPSLVVPKDLNHSTFQRKTVAVKTEERQVTTVIGDFIEGSSAQTIETQAPADEKKEKPPVEKKAEVQTLTPAPITKQPALPEDPLPSPEPVNAHTEKRITPSLEEEIEASYIDFIMFDAGATRLRTNEKFTPVWRLVGKALSRSQIEITSRNKPSGQFIVQYDPNLKDFTDETVEDELLFIFSDDHYSKEKEYRIRILSYKNILEIIVLDHANLPLSDGTGLKLLKLIFNTLHSELSAQKK